MGRLVDVFFPAFLAACTLLMATLPLTYTRASPGHYFKEDMRLTYSSESSIYSRIALTPNPDFSLPYYDYVHVVWMERQSDGTYEVCYRRGSRSGNHWMQTQYLTPPDGVSSSYPVIAARYNKLFVAWQDKREGDQWEIYFKYSLDYGESWSEDIMVTIPEGLECSDPEIAVGSSYVYIAYEATGGVIGGNREVRVKRAALSDLETWSTILFSTPDDDLNSKDPTVAAYGSYVYFAWLDYKWNSRYEIFFTRSSDNGASWESEQRLTECPGTTSVPYLAASQQYVHLVWNDNCGTSKREVWYKRSTNYGASGSWSSSVRLSTADDYDSWNPKVDAGSDTVAVAWYDTKPGNREIYCIYSFNNGETWQQEARLTYETHSSYRPDVAVSYNYIAIAWHDMRAGNSEIYFKRGALKESIDMTYVLFSGLTYLVCGHWERPSGSQVIPAATSDTAGAGLVGSALGAYTARNIRVRFDSDIVDPQSLSWLDTAHNLIVFGGPFVNSVSKKLEAQLDVALTVNPDGTWTLTTPLGSFNYDPNNIGGEDLIYIALLKDHNRYILFIMGLTPYGTTAGAQLIERLLNPWPANRLLLMGASRAVVSWQAATPNQINPGDTWTVLAAG